MCSHSDFVVIFRFRDAVAQMCVVSYAFQDSLLQLGMIGVFLFDPAAIRPSNHCSTVLAQCSPNACLGVGLCSPTLDDARPLLAQCLASFLPEVDPRWGSAQEVVRVRLQCAGMARWRRKAARHFAKLVDLVDSSEICSGSVFEHVFWRGHAIMFRIWLACAYVCFLL